MTRLTALAGTLVATLFLAAAATAAAPNYVLVSGPGLARPVLLADWTENHVLLLAIANAPKANASVVHGLAGRPRLDLAEFWGWGDNPRPTRASQANQHGWFYPAHGGRPAVFMVMVEGTRAARLGPARALEILARHGVPRRL